MGTRIAKMLDLDAIAVTATTFHAFCAKMLREYGGEVGWKTDWTILDSDDTRKMMRVCWKDSYGNPPDKDDLNGVEDARHMMFAYGRMRITVEREPKPQLRPEERRGGKERVSTVASRVATTCSKKNK